MRENGPKKDQLNEKSAICDLVGLILALRPHYFVREQLDDELMYSLLEIQSVVLDKKQKKNADSHLHTYLTMQGICLKEREM